jgi:hypothetical protein
MRFPKNCALRSAGLIALFISNVEATAVFASRHSTFIPSGPITLSSGQTVTGLSISNPSGACITGSNVSNVHIYNNKIGPCGPDSSGNGIAISGNAHDITIDHNSFDDVASAAYVVNGTNNIVFSNNYASRIRGPMPRGQLIQFNNVNGAGNQIICNVSDQTSPGYNKGTEDHISTYMSSGTAASPVLIKYNKLRGGGPSTSGGGIMMGDNGSSYITVDTNIVINPGQYGIAIAGGINNKILNNKIYSSSFPWTNVGAYVWNQETTSSYGHEVSGNRINWTNSSGRSNNWWDGGNTGSIIMNNNVFGDSTLSTDAWSQTFSQCNS